MGYQNFFATRLFTDIGAGDTTITLENPPTPTSGRLVLEARNTSKREIISYTGVSGNNITGVTRGVGGTSATDHAKNSLVEMNVVAEDLTDALAVPSDIITRFDEVINDHVASGLVWTDDTGLTADMSAGVAYINGIRLNVSAVNNRTFTASKDTYVDLGDNGVLDYNEVANNATPPALAASHLRLAKVVTNATDTTSITLFRNSSSLVKEDGWRSGHPIPVTVTYEGNRQYTLTYASSIAGFKSTGMRNRYVQNTGATYMGGLLNGSSQAFTKVAPTGSLATFTNNFSIKATVHPNALPAGRTIIFSRADASGNNGLQLTYEATGQLLFIVMAAAGSYRQFSSLQSLVLGKKHRIWVTWASGTCNVYIDGVPITLAPVAVGGTAPTVAGTGGDWSIGKLGATSTAWFPGYISDVAVFDTVLSTTTMKSYDNQPITGAEANCIGAWSLNNTLVNQQSPGTNDLTAVGSAGFTNMSPYNNDASSRPAEGVSYSITTFVSADGLTEYVQCPEANTITTTGTITSISYSSSEKPYGMPNNRRFTLSAINSTYDAALISRIASHCTPLVYENVRWVNTGTATSCFMFLSITGVEKIVSGYCPTSTSDLTVLYPPVSFTIAPIVAAGTAAAGAFNTFAMALGQNTTGFTARTVDNAGAARAEALSFTARGI